MLTGITVFAVLLIMYVAGGEGIKGFAFTMLIGLVVGTYSTFSVAVPMVQHERVMWTVSITIAALTLIGLITMAITKPMLQWVLIFIVAGLAIVLAARYLAGTRSEEAPLRRQPAPAGV
jgi:hypothetical protein